MPVFVLFVFGAVILGAGAMLSPAWPTKQPRVGLAAAFALAIVVGGSVFYASLFEWDTLVIDYLLFALVVGIFLGGTLSIGQARAEKRGETLSDADQGWTGPQDLFFFLAVALICAAPVLLFPAPPGEKGQLYGFLALTTRAGGTFDTLAPFQPQIAYLYAPGFPALTAYLSQQLNQSIPTVQFSVGAVLALLNVWVAYDFGAELRDKRLGRAMALAMLASLGLLGVLLDADFTALLGLLFTQAFFIFAIRYTQTRYPVDAVGAGLMLGAVAFSQASMLIIALLGYIPWLATMWLGSPRPSWTTWGVLALGVPLVALAGIAPWLADILPLLGAGLGEPIERSAENMFILTQYHGVWIVFPMALGLYTGWLRRDPVVILAATWLLFILDFSTTGGITGLLPALTRYANPADVAWHGPIIPYSILGGMGLLWAWDSQVVPRTGAMSYRQSYAANALIVVGVLLLVIFNRPALTLARDLFNLPGAYASQADVRAMLWLRDNTPADARVLNYPVEFEGEWVPVIAERDSVYFPLPHNHRDDSDNAAEREALRAFWHNPADPAHADLLREAGISYVIVPQVVTNPQAARDSWRWREPPETQAGGLVSAAPYLQRVYERDGAAVYAVRE